MGNAAESLDLAPGRFAWTWRGRQLDTGYDALGSGPSVVLLPAPSTVSCRQEMRPLAERLSGSFRLIVPDWPGFGEHPRPSLRYAPDLYGDFLRRFASEVAGRGAAVVAAGHAAGYALALGREVPGAWSRIVLVAPTWRGPLPTMMGGYRPIQARIRAAVEAQLLGDALYRLNVSKPVVAMMYRRHVYADQARLTPDFIRGKLGVARQPGARFASAAFVTGGLDLLRSRDDFLALASPPPAPTLLVYGADTPPRSRAEMDALADLGTVQVQRLSHGSPGLHEEHAAEVAQAVAPFLAGDQPP